MPREISPTVLVALNTASCIYIAVILPCSICRLVDFVHKRYLFVEETTLYAVWAALFVGSVLLVTTLLVAGSNGNHLVRKAESCCVAAYAVSATVHCILGNFPVTFMLLLVLIASLVGRFVRSMATKKQE